jgi:hypothetical protein
LRERIIFITGPIDDNVAASICMQLLFLEAENPKKEISMYIVLVISCVVIYFSYPAGQTGGEITHPEVSNSFKAPVESHEE